MVSSTIRKKTIIGSPASSWAPLKVRLFKCAAAKAISLALASLSLSTQAIIFLNSADPEKNTTAPTGTLANSGWELQGNWMVFQGTPIGPHHFITAAHVGGAVGETFQFRGVSYTTVSTSKDPNSDLQIWEVSGTFPIFAQLYDGPSETGRDLVVFGRGYIRGEEVLVNGVSKGWKWGPWDQRLRWGRNTVSALVEDQFGQPIPLSPTLLKATFDFNGSADEAHLAGGDSGGGVFIQQAGVWRLAGVNYTVDGYFNTTNSGPGFSAALFDEGGLYRGSEGSWTPIPDTLIDQPSAFYATRIKSELTWIQSVLAQPGTPLLVGANSPAGPFVPASGASVDSATKTIRVPISSAQFYQLQSSASLRITSNRIEGETMILQYE